MRARLLESRAQAVSAGVSSLAWRVAASRDRMVDRWWLSRAHAIECERRRTEGLAGMGRTMYCRTDRPLSRPHRSKARARLVPRHRTTHPSRHLGKSAALLLLLNGAAPHAAASRALAMRSAAPAGCRAAPLARFAAGSRQLTLCVARSRAPCRPPRAVVQAPACAASLRRGAGLLRCTAASPLVAARRSSRLCASLGSKVRGGGAPAALAEQRTGGKP